MSTSTAPAPRTRTSRTDFLDARGAASLFDMGRENWYRFARDHDLQPELTDPKRWRRSDLVLWMRSIPTLENVEESGEWVCRRNSGYCTEVFWHWHNRKLLQVERDFKQLTVKITHEGRTEIRDLTFYRRSTIDKIFAANKKARSEKLKDHWERLQEVTDDKAETWLLSGAAAKFLGVTEATLGTWSDKSKGGCPYLVRRRPLKTTVRFKPHRRWALSSLMAAAEARDAWPTISDCPEVYSPKETRRLTGVGKKTLKSTKKSLERGLVRILVPVITKRGDHLFVTRTGAFTKDSVDAHIASKTRIPPEKMKLSAAAKRIGIAHGTALNWWREGLLDGGFEEYDTAGNGRTESILILKKSANKARDVLSSAGGNAQAARDILRAQAAGAGKPDHRIPPDRMTVSQVVIALNGPCRETVITWCEDGLLDAEYRRFAPSSATVKDGWLITKNSFKDAKDALQDANGDVFKAARTLRAIKGRPIRTKPRSEKVEEVLEYIYWRWINGDPIKDIRDGAEARFGHDRAPKRWTKITSMAKEYARRHSLPDDRKRQSAGAPAAEQVPTVTPCAAHGAHQVPSAAGRTNPDDPTPDLRPYSGHPTFPRNTPEEPLNTISKIHPDSIKAIGEEIRPDIRALAEVIQQVRIESPRAGASDSLPRDTIISHGKGIYSINDSRLFVLSDNEDAVLQAFLQTPAMDRPTLEAERNAVSRPDKVLAGIRDGYDGVFAPAIHLAGGKGKGGYSVVILRPTKPAGKTADA